jgi:hypothetical protein
VLPLESNLLETLLPDWSIPLGAVYWVTLPETPLPRRVEVLRDFLVGRLTGNDARESTLNVRHRAL